MSFGFYIKHQEYNRYLGFTKGNNCVWTTKDKAYVYCTLLNAQTALKSIKNHAKYNNSILIIVNVQDQEVRKII